MFTTYELAKTLPNAIPFLLDPLHVDSGQAAASATPPIGGTLFPLLGLVNHPDSSPKQALGAGHSLATGQ